MYVAFESPIFEQISNAWVSYPVTVIMQNSENLTS